MHLAVRKMEKRAVIAKASTRHFSPWGIIFPTDNVTLILDVLEFHNVYQGEQRPFSFRQNCGASIPDYDNVNKRAKPWREKDVCRSPGD